MPPVAWGFRAFFSVSNAGIKPAEFAADNFSSPGLLWFFLLEESQQHRQHSVRKTLSSWLPHGNTGEWLCQTRCLPRPPALELTSSAAHTQPRSTREELVQGQVVSALSPPSAPYRHRRGGDSACLCLQDWFPLNYCSCLFPKKYQENQVLLSFLSHLAP